MVSDTRSARKNKDEADDHSSKKKANFRKDSAKRSPGVSGARTARGTSSSRITTPTPKSRSSSRQTTPSPQSMRKSKRLEKGMSPLSPPVKRKSERLDKHNTPSPMRRSDRGKINSSSSSGSKPSAKEVSVSDSKRRKEKTLIQLTMESKKAELDLEEVGNKRKRMNARTFKALFKRQRVKEIVSDGDVELEGRDKLPDFCGGNNRGIGSEPMRNDDNVNKECNKKVVGEVRNESIDKTDDGALQNSICNLKGCHADIENDGNVDSVLRDNFVDEPCSKCSETNLSVKQMSYNTERLPTNCFSTENIDAPESESSICLARSRDGSVSSDNYEKFMQTKVAGTTSLPSSECINLLGTCFLCSKNRRVSYDTPEQELCSCNPAVNEDLPRISTCEGTNEHGAVFTSEFAEKCDSGSLLKEMHADSQMDGHENVCVLCHKDGELLCCKGKGCRRCYHLCCLDPPFTDALPGVWHCPQCVKKKLLLGVHSVSEGVESIWGVREVEVSNAKGVRQRQYLVKYHGLAHIHNHWVPETQLLTESPSLISNFVENEQVVRWSEEWTVPNRLLRKRSIQDKIYIASSAVISVCNYEWLVKWQGLSYDHATWELETADFLSSPLGQNLMKDYEIRCEKAKQDVNKHQKESVAKLSELPTSRSLVNGNNVLENVNKLRDCLFKSQNAVVFHDEEQAMTVISFIQSMSEICRPFLIVTASSSLSQWEAEFARLAPSVDVVVFSGNRDTRKGIRASEFYEGGHVMLQVLLSSAEAVFEDIMSIPEGAGTSIRLLGASVLIGCNIVPRHPFTIMQDLDILKSIKWEAIVIDGYRYSGLSHDLEQIRMLTTDLRILLVSGQIKDTTSEYLNILSVLEPDDDFNKLEGLKSDTNENFCKLKDRLSHYIANGSTSQVSKFIEYWVPVQLSNYQLEQYCATLLSNSIVLQSCSKNDHVGALRDILVTVRKCCDHPYLLDSSVQERLIAEQRPPAELLDIGIQASGKLQLLDTILPEVKKRGLRVLILFQLIVGSGRASTGDILDDFLRQRFGQDTYERVDAGLTRSKKQDALDRFNKKEKEQFVFLLENRACSSVIKLSSLDVIFIYDSEWNPALDLRALQKISIDSKVEQIKIFRLYSSFTVEEKALVLAKKNLNLDNNLQAFSRTTSDTLLSWGAMHLFNELDKYHSENNSNSDFNFSSGKLLLNDVTKEFQTILSGSCENADSHAVISKVKLGVGKCSTNVPMLGEAKVELKNGEEPRVFWRNLLDGKNPHWKHLQGPSPRNRKRVHYLDGSPGKSETEKHDVVKKRKKVVNKILDPAVVGVELGANQLTQAAGPKGGSPTTIKPCNKSQDSQRDQSTPNNNPHCISGQSSFGDEVSLGVSEDKIVSSDEQKGLHSSLQGEITRLCQILKLSEHVAHTARKFLDFVIKNHHVNSDSPSIVQAFQISVCWIASSMSKEKIDKKESLMLAEKLLNYQCTEEQANTVYSKMRSLKRIYLQCTDNNIDSSRNCFLAEEDVSKEPNDNEWRSPFSSNKQIFFENETGEKAPEEHAEGQVLLQHEVAVKDSAASSQIDNAIKKIQKKCDKRMKKLRRKHEGEIKEFDRVWEEKREELEKDHKVESALIRVIHGQGSVGVEKLKLVDTNFAKKMEEHNLLKDMHLKDLEAEQLAAMTEVRQKAAELLAKLKACPSELGAVNQPLPLGSQSGDDVVGSQPSKCNNVLGPGEVLPMSEQHQGDQAPSESFCTRENYATTSFTYLSPPVEVLDRETPCGNLATDDTENGRGLISSERSSLATVEHLNQSKNSSNHGETVSADLRAPMEQVSDENQSVDPVEELPIEVNVPNEFVGHVHFVKSSNVSEKVSDSESPLPDASGSQKDGTDESVSGSLQNPEQPHVHSEQTLEMLDCSDVLPEQVQQDKQDEIHLSSVSAELQNLDAPAAENQSTSQIEVATPALVDAVTSVPIVPEAPVTDEVVTPVPTNLDAQDNVSLSCNPFLAVEDFDQGRNSSLTLEPEGAAVVENSTSRAAEDMEIHHDHLDMGLVSSATDGQSVDISAVCRHDVAIPQVMVSTAERPNQAVQQQGIDSGNLHGHNYLLIPPTHQPTSWNSTSLWSADPLQSELERIHKETEQLQKNHENMRSQLRSDCEKEIQEVIIQIRKKYDMKLQETEAEFRLKRSELDKNQNIVFMNKRLAEAFRSKCLDARPSGLPSMQQGVRSSSIQQLHQLSAAPSRRSPPSASQSFPSQHNQTPAVQTMQREQQQLSRTHSVRASVIPGQSATAPPIQAIQNAAALQTPAVQTMQREQQQQLSRTHSVRTSVIPGQSATAPPIQAIQNAAALLSGTTSTRPPPVISSITPARNPRVGGEFRSPAPHLQPFRPPLAAASSPSVSEFRPLHLQPSQPLQTPIPPPPPPRPPLANLVSRNSPELQNGLPVPPNPSISTLGLDRQPSVPESRAASNLPEIGSTFGPLETEDLENIRDVQGNQTTSATETNVVCLSDDE